VTINFKIDEQMIDDMKMYYGITPYDNLKRTAIGPFQLFKENFELKYHMTMQEAFQLYKGRDLLELIQKVLIVEI